MVEWNVLSNFEIIQETQRSDFPFVVVSHTKVVFTSRTKTWQYRTFSEGQVCFVKMAQRLHFVDGLLGPKVGDRTNKAF